MYTKLICITTLFLVSAVSHRLSAQAILVNDNLADRTKFIDNTKLTLFGSNSTATTGFNLASKMDGAGLAYNALTLTADAQANSGYVTTNSLKTLTSIDYQFNELVDREANELTIEFDGVWDAQGSSGENGRLVVTLIDAYPTGGANFGDVDNIGLSSPFGRPIYNVRIRNNTTASANGPLMLYGAGTVPQPDWEIYSATPNNWWLPGFSVQAGGGSPGSLPNYPVSGTYKVATSITSITKWKHYTWKIMPEKMELYQRNSDQSAASNTLVMFMQIPKNISNSYVLNSINTAHGTTATTMPPNYNWFQFANAVRFYWRGADNSHLANIKVTKTAAVLSLNDIQEFKATSISDAENEIMVRYKNNSIEKLLVEYSTDGNNFTTLKEIVVSNTGVVKITHDKINKDKNYYRLKVIDRLGKVQFSDVKLVKSLSKGITIFNTHKKITITLSKEIQEKTQLTMYDVMGKKIVTETLGNYATEINHQLTTGIYIYTISNGTTILKKGSIVIQ
jgi:hypothetical protein